MHKLRQSWFRVQFRETPVSGSRKVSSANVTTDLSNPQINHAHPVLRLSEKTLLRPFLKNLCSIIPSLFWNASVWMCIHSSRMAAYYTLSGAVTAAFSEEAKHFTAQTMYPGRRAHRPYTSVELHTDQLTQCTSMRWKGQFIKTPAKAGLRTHRSLQKEGRMFLRVCACTQLWLYFFALVWLQKRSAHCVPLPLGPPTTMHLHLLMVMFADWEAAAVR